MTTDLTDLERLAGERADFYVYYRRNGKLFFDAMWAASAAEARATMRGFARELGWTIKIVKVDAVQPDA